MSLDVLHCRKLLSCNQQIPYGPINLSYLLSYLVYMFCVAVILKFWNYTSWFFFVCVVDWRCPYAACALDVPTEHEVWPLHHRKWRVELWSGTLGNLHLRKAALLWSLKRGGLCTHALSRNLFFLLSVWENWLTLYSRTSSQFAHKLAHVYLILYSTLGPLIVNFPQ